MNQQSNQTVYYPNTHTTAGFHDRVNTGRIVPDQATAVEARMTIGTCSTGTLGI